MDVKHITVVCSEIKEEMKNMYPLLKFLLLIDILLIICLIICNNYIIIKS